MEIKVNRQQSQLIDDLQLMASEGRNPDTMDLDLFDTKSLLVALNKEDQKVAHVVHRAIPEITLAVEKIVSAFRRGGRLIYVGAGTSGRLGVLDAVECPPTFSVSEHQIIALIAGGESAMYKAVEGAEDDPILAITELKSCHLCKEDVVVGIAASGRTPYTISALKYAKEIGAVAVGVSCNSGSELLTEADIAICAEVGPEALTGSTRLKSGTAQKLILNMLTTASMVKTGKSYENLMVDVHASNEKLKARAVRIVMQATACDIHIATAALAKANNNVKLAILLVLTDLPIEEAAVLLESKHGFLRAAVNDSIEQPIKINV
ncbi:N-acetylmuramic acid 6-phosphate etherase [Colwellia sp. 4_MG-2023]|uniref:N-acetylmuramic acid 6-phosphate etherase n=1 Tax=unclassified Colwellia TaxID=196834 RepID=UPI0026E1F98C|nr:MULTISPECIES: N-acetylmuramic acid 6-phosphate etherase [unclassified Colwellia]MDO6508282.1 N-acetylmuramic acid 6-phosphate etherase [Colwellia sp. 5_MG-2023]MDO6556899.1 N-acetylmuramic acid 6-phosphate etherase [Colwellia sp. 4_MG-2023]